MLCKDLKPEEISQEWLAEVSRKFAAAQAKTVEANPGPKTCSFEVAEGVLCGRQIHSNNRTYNWHKPLCGKHNWVARPENVQAFARALAKICRCPAEGVPCSEGKNDTPAVLGNNSKSGFRPSCKMKRYGKNARAPGSGETETWLPTGRKKERERAQLKLDLEAQDEIIAQFNMEQAKLQKTQADCTTK